MNYFYELGQNAALEKVGFLRQIGGATGKAKQLLHNLLGTSKSQLSQAADLQRRLQAQISRAVPAEKASLRAEAERAAKDYLRGMQT